MNLSKYIIAVDTICEGIQALERNEKGRIITYATQEDAQKELIDGFNELNLVRVESGEEPDAEPEEFVMALEDYVEGHKTIWRGE